MKEIASFASVVYLAYLAVSFSNITTMQTEMIDCAEATIESGNFEIRSQMGPRDFIQGKKLETDSKAKCKKMEAHAKAIEALVK